MERNTDADNDSDAQHPNCYPTDTDGADAVSDAYPGGECPHCGSETRRVGRGVPGDTRADLVCARGHTVAHDVAGAGTNGGVGA